MRTCLKRKASSPVIVERDSRRRKSRRTRSSSTGSTFSRSGESAPIAPAQKVRPMTAARWINAFAFRGSRSMRAAIRACTVSGIRSGTEVEQLRSGKAEDQERRLADALGEVLHEVEQRLLGPVDVLEDEDERLRVGQLGRPLARRPRDLLRAALLLHQLEHSGSKPEEVGDGVVAAGGPKLADGLLDRIVV